MARLRENPEVRRAQIFDAAILMLGEQGFNGITVQRLAQRCGVSNAGLLHYFPSKDEILLGVLDELERREADIVVPLIAAAADKASEGAGASRGLVLELLRSMLERFAARPDLGRFLVVMQAEALHREHLANAWFRDREAMTIDLFADLLATLAAEPRRTARQLVALLYGLGQIWLRGDWDFDLLATWDSAVAALIPERR